MQRVTYIALFVLLLGASNALPSANDIIPEEDLQTGSDIILIETKTTATSTSDYEEWQPGEDINKNLDDLKEWPSQTCWRETYKADQKHKKSDGSNCEPGYVEVGKKTCRSNCPEGWVTCGIREDRGLMCGQTRKDCAEAKFEMVKATTAMVAEVAAAIGTGGASQAVSAALKAIDMLNAVMDFMSNIYTLITGTAYEKLEVLIGGEEGGEDLLGVLEEFKKYYELWKQLKDVDTSEEADQIRRRLLAIMGKFVGQELIGMVDIPLGIGDVVAAYKKPKCHNPNFYWFLTEETSAVHGGTLYNITSDVSIDKSGELCDDVGSVSGDKNECGAKEKDSALVEECTTACNADPLCVGFQFKEGTKGGKMRNGDALSCYQKDKKHVWYEKFNGDK